MRNSEKMMRKCNDSVKTSGYAVTEVAELELQRSKRDICVATCDELSNSGKISYVNRSDYSRMYLERSCEIN